MNSHGDKPSAWAVFSPRPEKPDWASNASDESGERAIPDGVHSNVEHHALSTVADRWVRIAQRARELARQRGFSSCVELVDWLQAERDIDGAPERVAHEHPSTS